MTDIVFDWNYDGLRGQCRGTSFRQALDRARVSFLRNCGIAPDAPRFQIEKSKLRSAPIRLSLSPNASEQYRRLWRGFQQGELQPEQRDLLQQFQQVIKDKDHWNASR